MDDSNMEKPAADEESLTEFRASFTLIRKASYMLGIDLSTRDRDVNIRFIGTMYFILQTYGLCLYSGWILRSNWYQLLELSFCLLLNLHGSCKMWIAVVNKLGYYQLFQTTERIYKCFDADERNTPILRDSFSKMNILVKLVVVIYVSSGLLLVIFVVLYAAVTGQKFLVLTIYVPFVDYTTTDGFIVHTLIHLSMIAICVDGYLASDTAFVAIVVPVLAYGNSLQNEITNFNVLLQAPKRNEKLISEKLVRICKLHQMIVEYEQDAVDHFELNFLAQMLFHSGALLVTIFLSYVSGYVQAFSIFLALLFQLTQFCGLGTIVTAKNDQMIIDIYGIDWHLLNRSQQKLVSLMLHRAQTANNLSIGGIAPLNMETYVRIIKSIYSYLAMLMTVLK